jgi:3-hydroxyacyl-[acyl-carrier-protein] dehydratase
VANPLDLLPHQPPMRLIETVTELIAGERASGGRRAASTDFYFDGHFPGEPVVPAIILVEMVAQIGGLAAGSPAHGKGERPIRLRVAGLGPFKFPAAAKPGAWLEAHARVAGRLGAMYKIDGDVTSDGEVVAIGSVTLAGVPDTRASEG